VCSTHGGRDRTLRKNSQQASVLSLVCKPSQHVCITTQHLLDQYQLNNTPCCMQVLRNTKQ
jgi:hypothetical protein